jgi:hypothetical protein
MKIKVHGVDDVSHKGRIALRQNTAPGAEEAALLAEKARALGKRGI